MPKGPTVYDVAERAGVSIATVSFAFRRPEKVKASTREMVLAVARELGYVPSASARGLAHGRTRALGLFAFEYLLHVFKDLPTVGAFNLGKHWQLWMGLFIVLLVAFAPRGLLGLMEKFIRRKEDKHE